MQTTLQLQFLFASQICFGQIMYLLYGAKNDGHAFAPRADAEGLWLGGE